MIDTIVLRIHGYEKYDHLVKYLKQINTKDYVTRFHHTGVDDLSRSAILYGDTGNILPLKHRSSIFIPSSHYSISFDLNQERDYIEFNLSIPKYIYATNVLQFVDQHNTGSRHTFDKLIHFITRFFAEYLPLPPDSVDVEINRIDLCYNQFFLSKADALRYLDEQRKINIDYARSDKNKGQSYGTTTVMYVTDNYSFKIYHKGTEFRKNDYTKLLKNNPRNYNIPELLDAADKILRYEISCKKGLFNYLFKQYLKDDENTMFNHNLTQLRTLRNKKSITINNHFTKMAIPKTGRDPVDLFIHKTLPGKSFGFFLDSLWEMPMRMPIDLLENFCLGFNFELFDLLWDFFWEKVKKYQLGIKMGIQEVFAKIKEHQNDKDFKNKLYGEKEKIAQTGQLLLIATLSQFTDISDLKQVLPKATYYRYVKKLENLGIPKHSPDIAVAPPPLDYVSYFFYFSKHHNTYN